MAKLIRITCARPGFRRAGMAHPKGPAEYPADRFDKAQLALLKAEPLLSVEEVDGELPNTGEGDSGGGELDAAQRAEAIRAAVAALDKNKDFTADGAPKVGAVEKAAGFDTNRDEIDAALAATA